MIWPFQKKVTVAELRAAEQERRERDLEMEKKTVALQDALHRAVQELSPPKKEQHQ